MNLNNFLYSGFKFSRDEDLLKFKFKMLNSMLIIIAFFSLLFAIISDLGINDLGPIQTKVDYIYCALTLSLIFFLRASKSNYNLTAYAMLMVSLIAFTFALIFVPQDEFRIIWFYLLIFAAYIVNGKKFGLMFTAASIIIILVVHMFIELNLSQTAINSAILGLVIGSFLAYFYTSKITSYEHSLKEQNSSLNLLASTDYLTGIMNKRMFNDISEHYFQTAQKDRLNLTLLLLDLDHFKKVNDTYGHQAGDILLKNFVKNTKGLLNKSDIFARIGGEEFAILLSQSDIDGAYMLAEKIRKETQNLFVKYEGQDICVTTSIGISQNRKTDTAFENIFSRADTALYHAKSSGRNKTYHSEFSQKGEEQFSDSSMNQTTILHFSI